MGKTSCHTLHSSAKLRSMKWPFEKKIQRLKAFWALEIVGLSNLLPERSDRNHMPWNLYQLRQSFQINCREQAYFGIEVDCTGLCLCRQISVIQTLQHKGTYVTKSVYYLCYVDVLVHDSDSNLQFKCTSKKKSSSRGGDSFCTVVTQKSLCWPSCIPDHLGDLSG